MSWHFANPEPAPELQWYKGLPSGEVIPSEPQPYTDDHSFLYHPATNTIHMGTPDVHHSDLSEHVPVHETWAGAAYNGKLEHYDDPDNPAWEPVDKRLQWLAGDYGRDLHYSDDLWNLSKVAAQVKHLPGDDSMFGEGDPDREEEHPVIYYPKHDTIYVGDQNTHHADLWDKIPHEESWSDPYEMTSDQLGVGGDADRFGLNYALISPEKGLHTWGGWNPEHTKALYDKGYLSQPDGSHANQWNLSKVAMSPEDKAHLESQGWHIEPPRPENGKYIDWRDGRTEWGPDSKKPEGIWKVPVHHMDMLNALYDRHNGADGYLGMGFIQPEISDAQWNLSKVANIIPEHTQAPNESNLDIFPTRYPVIYQPNARDPEFDHYAWEDRPEHDTPERILIGKPGQTHSEVERELPPLDHVPAYHGQVEDNEFRWLGVGPSNEMHNKVTQIIQREFPGVNTDPPRWNLSKVASIWDEMPEDDNYRTNPAYKDWVHKVVQQGYSGGDGKYIDLINGQRIAWDCDHNATSNPHHFEVQNILGIPRHHIEAQGFFPEEDYDCGPWAFPTPKQASFEASPETPNVQVKMTDDVGTASGQEGRQLFQHRRPLIFDPFENTAYVGGFNQTHQEAAQSHGGVDYWTNPCGAWFPNGYVGHGEDFGFQKGQVRWFSGRIKPEWREDINKKLNVQPEDNWNFSKVANGHVLNWTPGEQGKGLVERPSGRVHTWNVDRFEAPHHTEYMQDNDLAHGPQWPLTFEINPAGMYDSWGDDMPELHQHLQQIPNLRRYSPDDMWGFTSHIGDIKPVKDPHKGRYNPTLHMKLAAEKEADYYHLAPTTDRARVRQHGLIPAYPGISERWMMENPNADEETPEEEWYYNEAEQQPTGVYVTPKPLTSEEFGLGEQMDRWRIPTDQVHFVHPDGRWRPEAQPAYIPHSIPDPILDEPYEWSHKQNWRSQEGAIWPENHPEWGIGRPNRVWGKVAAIDWEEGNEGKGVLLNDGSFHSWNVDERRMPNHVHFLKEQGIDPSETSAYFEMNPEGKLYNANSFDPSGLALTQEAAKLDPRLFPAEGSHWDLR